MPTIQTDDLSIAYEDSGSGERGTAVLLHGWPDDASTWSAVLPALNSAGFRTIVPTLRGFGDTRFLTAAAPRTGNSGILAMDVIALMDGLGIKHFAALGHDWGANIAEALAVGWPDRVERIAMLSTPPRLGGVPTPPFWHAQLEWYHWFMATPRGAQAVRDDRRGFARIHWENWSPPGWFDEATFDQVARSFENPDWVDVTLHSYRSRWDVAAPDPRSAALEAKVKATQTLSLPAIYIQGVVDGVNPPAASTSVPKKFAGPFEFVELPGVGHFPQREAPDAVAEHLLALLDRSSR
ncbi:MAG: alpha/beta fold hydrolase [Janthinobacterium lividum]